MMRINLLLFSVLFLALIDISRADLQSPIEDLRLSLNLELSVEIDGSVAEDQTIAHSVSLSINELEQILASPKYIPSFSYPLGLTTKEDQALLREAIVKSVSQAVSKASSNKEQGPSNQDIATFRFILELYRKNPDMSESIAWMSQISAANELINQLAYLNNFSEEHGSEGWFRKAKGNLFFAMRRLEVLSGYRHGWLNRPDTVLMYSDVDPEYFIRFIRHIELYRLSLLFGHKAEVTDEMIEEFIRVSRQLVGVRKSVGGPLFSSQLQTLLAVAFSFVPNHENVLNEIETRLAQVSEESLKMGKSPSWLGETIGGGIQSFYNSNVPSWFSTRISGQISEAQTILNELRPAIKEFRNKASQELQGQASFVYQFSLGFVISHFGVLPLRAGEVLMNLLSLHESTDKVRKTIEENLAACVETCNVVVDGGNDLVEATDKFIRETVVAASPLAESVVEVLQLRELGEAAANLFKSAPSPEVEVTDEDEEKAPEIEKKISIFSSFHQRPDELSCNAVFF